MPCAISNEQILCIGLPAWEGDYLKSTVQLVSEIAKNNQVLYVEYPFTWKDVILAKLGKGDAPYRRVLGQEPRLRKLQLGNGAEVNVLTLPPMLPVNFIGNESLFDTFMAGNARRAYKAIRQAMQKLGFENPVVINSFNPSLGVFLARQFDEKALIYYCYDEINAAKWVGKHGGRLEFRFMQEADAVITSSSTLFQSKQAHARLSFLVKNGVDFDLFHQSNSQNQQPESTVGYLGSLDERVDYDLLEKTVATLPHRHFIFVGRVNSVRQAERLRNYPNVGIVGSQPPSSLPGWVGKFNVCIIPFLKNDLTAGIYPLKINEYFAAGKPVVTTKFGDISDFAHLVSIADTPETFAAEIERFMDNGQDEGRGQRIAFARQNSWAQRAQALSGAIASVLDENRTTALPAPAWMPDTYNRWGETSARFFSGKETSQPFFPPDWHVKPAMF